MKPQLLIFDLDGTLVDSRLDLCAAINLMRNHFHLPPLPPDTLSSFIGDGKRSLVMRSLEGHSFDLDEAVRIYYGFYLRHIHDRTVLYPGVAAGLRALYNHGHILAIVTNKDSEPTRIILSHFKILDRFRSIICGDSSLPLKPQPETVLETIRITKSTVAATWVIGDNHTDLGAARNAGAKGVFVTYGIGKAGAEDANLAFADFSSLVQYFINDH